MLRSSALLSAVVCALGSFLGAQRLTWIDGASAGDATIRSVPEATPGAQPTTVLDRVALVDLEITHRTSQRGLRTDVSRRVVRAGLAFVELPDGGSLYAYRRAGGAHWGYLWITADGTPRVVVERAGGGTGGLESPFDDRIGVAPDGRHAAIPLLDGRVLLARLDGGSFAGGAWTRDAGLPGLVEVPSLTCGSQVLWCSNENDQAFRIPYADASPAQDITPPGVANPRLKGEFAQSADGRYAVFLYGPRDSYTIYRVAATGPAVALPPPPAKYEEPGFLPETPDGPELLLSDDGARLFYVDAGLRDEAYALDIPSNALTHVTGDPNFVPYIGVTILPVAMAGGFVLGVGDPGRHDVFATTPGVPAVANLTRTGASAVRPWLEGNLVPRVNLATDDERAITEIRPTAGGPGIAVRFDPRGPVVLASSTDGRVERGSGFGRTGDLVIGSANGDVLVSGADGAPLLAAPAGVTLSAPARAPHAAFDVLFASAGNLRALVFLIPGGGLVAFPRAPASDECAITAQGAVLIDGAVAASYFAPGVTASVGGNAAYRRLLSGRVTVAR